MICDFGSDEQQATDRNQNTPHIVLAGFRASGMIARIYTLLFFHDCIVFAKTGTIVADNSNALITVAGNNPDAGFIITTLRKIHALFSERKPIACPDMFMPLTPQGMASAHKHNFVLKYNDIRSVEIKKPNWLGGVKILINTFETRTFLIDNVSKLMWYYIYRTFETYMPTKVNRPVKKN
ncbi:MAG TPA: hypothetical protein VLH16_04730 [Bacteroidales bacterium]|nr:hypothetical protein [Bacteroidales bacterium]